MIIDKLAPYKKEYFEKQFALREHFKKKSKKKYSEISDIEKVEQASELLDKSVKLWRELKATYEKEHTKQDILNDAKEILDALEKEDYQTQISGYAESIESVFESEDIVIENKESELASFQDLLKENYDNCCKFIIEEILTAQYEILIADEKYASEIKWLIDKKVSQWYVNQNKNYYILAHGKPTDAIAFANTKNMTKDPITGKLSTKINDVEIIIDDLEDKRSTLSISTDKLLVFAGSKFTKQNDFRLARKTKSQQLKVSFLLKEYAESTGRDIEPRKTSTPEEAKKEKQRQKNMLKNLKKEVARDLDVIYSMSLSWKEIIRGEPEDFMDVRVIQEKGIKDGLVTVMFSQRMAEYLIFKNLFTSVDAKLLKISGKTPTAYKIGRKLSMHYNLDNNQIRGTYNRLRVPNILAVSGLPSYEYLKSTKHARHWEDRIKEPFEKALEILVEDGILKSWKYTHAKGLELTDDEAYNIDTYEKFSALYLEFKFVNEINHKQRIAAKREAGKKKNKNRKRLPAKNNEGESE